MAKDPKGISRRELLSFWRKPLKELSESQKPSPPPLQTTPVADRPPPLRPPGMMHELMLVQACIRCGKCVEVCPADAIKQLDESWGVKAGTPWINARQQPCVLCDGIKCSHVCPSGALVPTYVANDVTMGTAVLDEKRCLPWQGTACNACIAACPRPGALTADAAGKISVVAALCTGCGVCEHVCPTDPASIHVVPRD
jgi:ferredoxin-type protein NapG